MMGVITSHRPGSKKEFFQIASDGQICDDSASDSESEIEVDEDKCEEESP
jgi:hypothetical protein